ncbi:MAG: HyaD/HybD family hydrogenase maturation endopeptidase [Desulfurivibrionaceae bacterium]
MSYKAELSSSPAQTKLMPSGCNILVLGVGNVLLADEGAGVRVVEQLQRRYLFPPQVELIDGGTMGLDLLGYLDDKTHLFIVDAIISPKPPGSVVIEKLLDPPAYFRQKISPHQIGLSELLAVASMQDCLPPDITLFGIVPLDLATGLEMSPEVSRAVEQVVLSVVEELALLGVEGRAISC